MRSEDNLKRSMEIAREAKERLSQHCNPNLPT